MRAIALDVGSKTIGLALSDPTGTIATPLEVLRRSGQSGDAGAICDLVDERLGVPEAGARRRLIEFVTDRPGHDLRYAIDSSKLQAELDWRPTVTFEEGLARTVDWYLANETWWRPIADGTYAGSRLGLA